MDYFCDAFCVVSWSLTVVATVRFCCMKKICIKILQNLYFFVSQNEVMQI